jgi:aminobenzoyl-glutamate utilization protein B
VITEGGDQPNVVPRTAAVWYYFREVEYPRIRELWEIGNQIARGATLMTGTTLDTMQVLGAAWPRHFNRPVAMAMYDNIRRVGLPRWDEADQTLARAVQKELGNEKTPGLDTALAKIDSGVPPEQNRGGGSDDIGDISWVVPTITLRYPSNIPNLPGHNWSSAIAMATPIAHKGATAGAKATAMTLLDLFTKPALVDSAWSYFRNVQTKDVKYEPLIRPGDQPPVYMNAQVMQRYRPEMRRFYYDPTRYRTYLEQLGIKYPTVRAAEAPKD